MLRILRIVGVMLLALISGAAPSWAGATIHVGSGAGTPCATGGCPVFNGETNNFGTSGLDLYQNTGGAIKDPVAPVLLILAVPNDTVTGILTSAAASTITGATLIAPYPGGSSTAVTFAFGSNSFGLNGSGFEGLMTSGDIYSFLGLKEDKSNNWSNLTTWDAAVDHITATNFGIYVYALNTASFGDKGLLDIGLTGVPDGTFAVGYEEDSKGKTFGTPFTEAGFRDEPVPAPEPSSIGLLATGILALPVYGLPVPRRRRRTPSA